MELKEEKQQEYTAIKNSVNLGVSIADLYDMYNTVGSKIEQLAGGKWADLIVG